MRSGKPDVSPNELYSQSAIYVAAAHALKPNYSVSIYMHLILSLPYSLDLSLFSCKLPWLTDLLSNAGLSQCFAISPLNGIIHFFFCF